MDFEETAHYYATDSLSSSSHDEQTASPRSAWTDEQTNNRLLLQSIKQKRTNRRQRRLHQPIDEDADRGRPWLSAYSNASNAASSSSTPDPTIPNPQESEAPVNPRPRVEYSFTTARTFALNNSDEFQETNALAVVVVCLGVFLPALYMTVLFGFFHYIPRAFFLIPFAVAVAAAVSTKQRATLLLLLPVICAGCMVEAPIFEPSTQQTSMGAFIAVSFILVPLLAHFAMSRQPHFLLAVLTVSYWCILLPLLGFWCCQAMNEDSAKCTQPTLWKLVYWIEKEAGNQVPVNENVMIFVLGLLTSLGLSALPVTLCIEIMSPLGQATLSIFTSFLFTSSLLSVFSLLSALWGVSDSILLGQMSIGFIMATGITYAKVLSDMAQQLQERNTVAPALHGLSLNDIASLPITTFSYAVWAEQRRKRREALQSKGRSFKSTEYQQTNKALSEDLLKKDGDNGWPEDQHLEACTVCLEHIEEGSAAIILPACAHAYHPGCISRWLRCKGNCPNCFSVVEVA